MSRMTSRQWHQRHCSLRPTKQTNLNRRLRVEPLEDRRMLAVLTVNSDLDGPVDLTDNVVTLRDALEAANTDVAVSPGGTVGSGADTIEFDPSLSGSLIRIDSAEFSITNSVMIDGANLGIVISGDVDGDDTLVAGTQITDLAATADTELDDNVRLFGITGGAVTFSGLTFTGGRTSSNSESGGGINSTSTETLTFESSIVSGNSTTAGQSDGGGIFASAAVVLNNTIVSGNSTSGTASDGGGIFSSDQVTLTNSSVSGNSTVKTTADGAGIYSKGGGVTLTDSTVNNNYAAGFDVWGGGIFSSGKVTLTNSTVSGNSIAGSDSQGAGIRTGGSNVILINSTVSGNTIGGGNSEGAGIRTGNGNVTLTNSTVSGNSITGDDSIGGGMRVGGTTTLLNSTVTNNSVSGTSVYGGGMYVRDDLTIDNSIVAGNTSSVGGADIYLDPAQTLTVNANHSLIGSNDGNGLVESQTADASGNLIGGGVGGLIDPLLGALANNGGPTQTHALVTGSPAIDAGDDSLAAALTSDQRGAPFARFNGTVDIGAYEVQTLNLVVDTLADESDGDFSANDLSLREALQLANANQGADTVSFDASLIGGVLRLDGALNALLITDEVTIDGGALGITITADVNGDDMLVAGTNISDVAASVLAGVVSDNNSRVFNITGSGSATTLIGLTITGGRQTGNNGRGGGIRSLAALTITNSTVSGNFTTGDSADGGGIYSAGNVTLTNSTVSGNSTTGASGDGGGIFSNGSIALTNSTVSGNSTTGNSADGGGIFSAGNITLTNSMVTSNVTVNSGFDQLRALGTLTRQGGTIQGGTLRDGGTSIQTGLTAADIFAATTEVIDGTGAGTGVFTGVLADYGGPTATMALLAGGAAVDTGDLTTANVAQTGTATQSSNFSPAGTAEKALDGDLTTITHTASGDANATWEVELTADFSVTEIVLHNRLTNRSRLWDITVEVLAADGSVRFASELLNPENVLGGSQLGQGPASLAVDLVAITGGPVAGRAIRVTRTPDPDNSGATGGSPGLSEANVLSLAEVEVVAADQRGLQRVVDGGVNGLRVDIGAYELQTLNLVVDTLTDESDGDYSSGDLSLREALELTNANPGADTIAFDASLAGGTINQTLGVLLITDDLTLAGLGADQLTIDAAGTSRVLRIDSGTVAISGLTLTGGSVGRGGGVRNYSPATTTLTDMVITGNTATTTNFDGGGGVFNEGDLTILNSTVSNNTAQFSDGGGVFNDSSGTLSVTNSTISGNSAGGNGGGIRNIYGTTTISYSTITGNSTANSGGGILVGSGTVTVSHSLIVGNTAANTGNEIRKFGAATANLDNYNLIGDDSQTTAQALDGLSAGATDILATSDETNSTALSSILDTTLADNGGPTPTHALIGGSPAINAGDSAITSPPDNDQRGAGFPRIQLDRIDIGAYEFDDIAIPVGGLVVSTTDDIFNGDYSQGDLSLREAIILANANAGADIVSFDAAVFTGGTANEILLAGEQLLVTETLTIDASALTENVTIDAQQNSRVLYYFATTGDLTLDSLTIQNGKTTLGIGGDGGGIRFDSDGSLTLTGSTISGSRSYSWGGGIYTYSGAVTLANSTISGNYSGNKGGGIATNSGTITLTGSNVSENFSIYEGGGLFLRFGNAMITGSTISDNYSGYQGGGIYSGTGPATITGSTVSGNTSAVGGGGIWTHSGGVTLTDSTVSGNVTYSFFTYDGGGIYSSSGNVTLTGSTVIDNTASNGAGIFTSSGNVTLTDSTVSGNKSSNRGGGIHIDTSGFLTLTNSTVSGNTSVHSGGGIWINDAGGSILQSTISDNSTDGGGGAIYNRGVLTITDSTLSDNSADHGGGIRGEDGTVTIARSTLSGNKALGSAGDGGALYAVGTDITISASTLSGNTSNDRGGGVYLVHHSSSLLIESSTLSANSAGRGGAVMFAGGTATVRHSTLTGNTATDSGGGIYAPSNLTLSHSVVSGNTATNDGNEIFGSASLDDYNLIGDSSQTTAQAISGATAGATDILATSNGTNVALTSILNTTLADNGGPTLTHALVAGSPAINAGDPAAMAGVGDVPEFDQRGTGFDRVLNGRIDIGAFEATVVLVDSADFDADGDVDGRDFLLWQRGFGSTTAAKDDGDADNNMVVDGDDFAIWQEQFGQPAPLVSANALSSEDSSAAVQSVEQPLNANLIDAALAMEWLDADDSTTDDLLRIETELETSPAALQSAELSVSYSSNLSNSSNQDPASANPDESNAIDDAWLSDELLEKVFG